MAAFTFVDQDSAHLVHSHKHLQLYVVTEYGFKMYPVTLLLDSFEPDMGPDLDLLWTLSDPGLCSVGSDST